MRNYNVTFEKSKKEQSVASSKDVELNVGNKAEKSEKSESSEFADLVRIFGYFLFVRF